MENNWFYIDSKLPEESRRQGPLTRVQIEDLAKQGRLEKDDLVWYPGLVSWLPWKSIAPDFPGNSSEHRCSVCGIVQPESQMTFRDNSWICSLCKEAEKVPTPAVTESTVPPLQMAKPLEHYASLGIRLAAFMVDLMILGTINAGLVFLYLFFFHIPEDVLRDSMLINIPGLLLEAFYQVYFLSRYGGTPGKMLMGLRVISADGNPLSVAHALGRYFSFWFSAISLGLGFLIILFDPQRRALHDHIARTRVIYFRTPFQ
ncbi:MAG TPA: RDD family protein [Fibrobacteraceae bacterium]|nr:RDD family protein [Fibrobacteraceae bacterium]